MMMRKNMNTLRLTDEQRKQIREQIHDFFLDEMDEDIGLIKQDSILTFMEENIGPLFYNRALDDAMNWLKSLSSNAENDYYTLYKDM